MKIKSLDISRCVPMLLALVLLTGCDTRPDNVLSEGRSVDLFTDLQVADAISETNPDYMTDSAKKVLRQAVFEKNGTTEQQYIATLTWYGHNLQAYSKMLEKVDKKLAKMQSAATGVEQEAENQKDGLWKYPKSMLISRLGNSNGIVFELSPTDLEDGSQFVWKMRLNRNTSTEMLLGADYEDGSTSYRQDMLNGVKRLEIKFQADTAKKIKRLYGAMYVNSEEALPVWVDSINLIPRKYDKDAYGAIHSQKNFSPQEFKPKKQVVPDTTNMVKSKANAREIEVISGFTR